METPGVGETNQGALLQYLKYFLNIMKYFWSVGSHDLARALHPGHGLHHCGAHDSQAIRDRSAISLSKKFKNISEY